MPVVPDSAASLRPARVGVYIGIFNMFIVIPMMIQIFTLPLYYDRRLGGNPERVVQLAGALLLCAAVAVLFVRVRPVAQPAERPTGP